MATTTKSAPGRTSSRRVELSMVRPASQGVDEAQARAIEIHQDQRAAAQPLAARQRRQRTQAKDGASRADDGDFWFHG
jgi:hypothetical protein